MEEIEYLEEYEDLILPMSFAVDDGKCNERLNDRKSIDSLEMLYKDLIEDTSLQQNPADTSPFSLNPQMISPEKTILSSSTVEIGLAQSFPNYSLKTTPPTCATTTNTDTLQSYQTQTPNIHYLNRLTNKSFSTYSSLQKPDKLKSVATVKPTLQRVNNPPKQYVQRESSNLKTTISGQSVNQFQHNFSKPTSTKTSFGLNNSSKNKRSLKISKLSAPGVDPLAGLDDDGLLDFDERNGIVDGFDFESDLENSIIAGLSDMDSESVELSDELLDDNFDLESDLSSEESDLKKLLKRKRTQLTTQDCSERQRSKLSNDLKRDILNTVKKKLSPSIKYGSEGQQHIQKSLTAELKEKLPTTTSSVGKDPSFNAYSTKVNELIANGSNILPQLSSKLNEHEHAHVSNVLNLTPTVPLCSKVAEKADNGFKQFVGITTNLSNDKSCSEKKDDQSHAIVDQFRGFDESLTSKSMEQQTNDVVKNKWIEQNLHKSPQNNIEMSNPKDVSSRLKFGSLYLRSIKPPIKKTSPIKTATNILQQPDPCKTPTVTQSTKASEESSETRQENTSSTPTIKNMITNNLVSNTVADVPKILNSLHSTPEATKIGEKRTLVPKISEAKDQVSHENVKESSQLKRHKSLGTLTASMTDKGAGSGKIQNTIEKKKAQIQSRAQKIINAIAQSTSKNEIKPVRIPESTSKKEINFVRIPESISKKEMNVVRIQDSTSKKELNFSRTQDGKQRDSFAKPKVQIQSIASLSPRKAQEAKVDLSDKSKVELQLKQKNNAEEAITSKCEKERTQEPKDQDVSDKLKVQNVPKLKYMGEKTAATLEKLSTPKANEAKEQDSPEQSKIKTHIKRRRSAVERNKNRSVEREANKEAAAPVTEKSDKQIKIIQKCGEDKRLEAVRSGNPSTQISNLRQKTNKILSISRTTLPSQSDKILPSQQNEETSLEKKTSTFEREKSLSFNRRKRIALGKFQGPNPKLKKTLDSQEVPNPPTNQAETVIAEKTLSGGECQKSVFSSPEKPIPQLLRKDTPQKVHKMGSSSPQSSKISSRVKSRKFSQRMLKPMSPRNFSLLEQKKLKIRGFKIRLNRKTVDHFMKSLKEHTKVTPASITNKSELKMVKSPLKNTQISEKNSPRPVGRPRKNFPKPIQNSQLPPSTDLKDVRNESQPPANSFSVTSEKVAQTESKVEDKVSLEVKASSRLKRRKKKKIQSNQPAKLLRSDLASSGDKSYISNKDCKNDRVPLKEQFLPDAVNSTSENTVIQTEAPIPAVRNEATNLPVPMEVGKSGVATNVISPIASTKTTISPTVPTNNNNANSPTFPTDAASPATPTGATSLETATSQKSPQTSITETSPSLNISPSKKRGRPRSKKCLMRSALTRRLELIRASTSQRLINTTVDPTLEEPTSESVPVDRHIELLDECIRNATSSPATSQSAVQTNEAVSPVTSQPPDQTNEIASQATSQPLVGPCLAVCNLVEPKIEVGDSTDTNYQMPGLAAATFDGAPSIYSFARPLDTRRRDSELLLDACQIIASSFSTEQSGTTENVTVFDLPSYIVMRTRIISRSELQKNKSVVPPKVKETINKLTENGHVSPVVKEEAPDFKDICLEINTLLGRNANYLKFASASERQARMNQVLSDSSLSAQEAQSALKFLQSYLSARSKDVAVNNDKGQQFIPIYDSQKKVIGYRKRRVHPKKSEHTTQQSRSLNRSSNPSSSSRTTSMNYTIPMAKETLTVQRTVVEFSTKKEPQTVDGGDGELIVPDTPLSANPIKCEIES